MINMKKIDNKQVVLKCGLDAESYREVKVGSHTGRRLYQNSHKDLFSYWNLLLRTYILTQDWKNFPQRCGKILGKIGPLITMFLRGITLRGILRVVVDIGKSNMEHSGIAISKSRVH